MIYEYLKQGEKNAITSKELAQILHIDTRYIRQMVRNERMIGHFICGSSKGYYMPETDADVKHTISRLYSQGRQNFKVAKAMQDALEQTNKD